MPVPDETLTEPFQPVEPFGAKLAQVGALIPNVGWVTGGVVGQTGVTAEQAHDWLVDLTARVAVVLPRWADLDGESRLSYITRLAADAVAHGAASYAHAAVHPEQVSKADLAYHQVLWNRHLFLLDQAKAQLEEWLDEQDTASGRAGIAVGCFPAASIVDGIGF